MRARLTSGIAPISPSVPGDRIDDGFRVITRKSSAIRSLAADGEIGADYRDLNLHTDQAFDYPADGPPIEQIAQATVEWATPFPHSSPAVW